MTTQGIVSVFQTFLDALNNQKWEEAHNHLQPVLTATYNETAESRDEFVNRLTATVETGGQLSADQWTVDEAAQSLGARLITTTIDAAKVWDIVLVFFGSGKIARCYQIANPQPGPFGPEVAAKPSQNPLSAAAIEALYRKYIYSYNDGSMPTVLPALWAKEVVLHGELVPSQAAVGFLGKILLPVVAGLKYEVDELVVDEKKQQIAVRLSISGVPQNKNLQKNGPGGEVTVYEQALYGFEEGKIAWAWASQAFDMTPPSS
ncbi:SnoaL-like polyketide cyclase [Colletotrichum orchidophilum]|uniref:SnoaL-like polyketide cyclase n=1 Tax=Colletotrichum orchidophilum TaxID=1209926 RepID=A0A1G4B2K5_9PEZI|nr:SnoaL-like polyketide cyclase [Colletotrichum orchidophilum]OHE95621.1 SnoaL-like polyketide cyclase [Colletotrichum orchidophilum]